MFAFVVAVVPRTRVTWDLPNPLVWDVLFLLLLLLHAERPVMRRGAWFQLWLAAGALFLLRVAELEPIRAYVMWGCALLLLMLLILSAHQSRPVTRVAVGAALTGASLLTIPALFGVRPALTVNMLVVESVFVLVIAAYAVLLALRHRQGGHRGVVVPGAALITALALAPLPVLAHPAVLYAYGLVPLWTAGSIPWLCLVLLGGAAVARARFLHLREESADTVR